MRIWDAQRRPGRRAAALVPRPGQPRADASRPLARGGLFATGRTRKNAVQFWDTTTWREQATLGVGAEVQFLACHPDGRTLLIAATDGSIQVWDAPARKPKRQPIRLQDQRFSSLVLRLDGRYIAFTREYRDAVWWLDWSLWDRAPSTGIARIPAFSPDSRTLITPFNDGTFYLKDMTQPGPTEGWSDGPKFGPARGVVQQVVYSPEGRHVAAIHAEGMVYVLRLAEPPNPAGR